MTVQITKFSTDKTMLDWSHLDHASGADKLVSSFVHDNDDKTILVLECDQCGTRSFYPMSGGVIAQTLHRNHRLQETLEAIQAEAEARNIVITDKTQEQLILEIIQHECNAKDVLYLL